MMKQKMDKHDLRRCESESGYLCRPPHSQKPERRIVVIRREENPMEAVASLRDTAADRRGEAERSRGFLLREKKENLVLIIKN